MAEEELTISELSTDVETEREKPRLVSLLFYDFSNRTETGKFNLLGVFDRLSVELEKKRTHAFGMFVKVAQVSGGIIRVFIREPDREIIAALDFAIPDEYPGEESYHVAQAVGTLEFDTPVEGLYWFEVFHNTQALGGAGLQIAFKSAEKNDGNDTSKS
ncbi:MAG: hypothetical protein HY231_02095 [Acidobacteria bacterium]|nr:hypothetical protein [Acidobacteriota bacterium]